jgi:hypothetical protein
MLGERFEYKSKYKKIKKENLKGFHPNKNRLDKRKGSGKNFAGLPTDFL